MTITDYELNENVTLFGKTYPKFEISLLAIPEHIRVRTALEFYRSGLSFAILAVNNNPVGFASKTDKDGHVLNSTEGLFNLFDLSDNEGLYNPDMKVRIFLPENIELLITASICSSENDNLLDIVDDFFYIETDSVVETAKSNSWIKSFWPF